MYILGEFILIYAKILQYLNAISASEKMVKIEPFKLIVRIAYQS